MTFDPNRTTVMPPVGFPITDELPAVSAGGRGPSGPLFLKLVGALLSIGMIAIAGVLIFNSLQADNTPTDNSVTVGAPTPAPQTNNEPAPTAVQLDDVEPGYWRVTGVPDGLNVRSGPGVDNDIVGALAAGDRHIFGTGERATVNGATWTQILFGANDSTGWVSSRFLQEDTPPDPNAPEPTATQPPAPAGASVVCFESQQAPTRIARLQFVNGVDITGLIRTLDGQVVFDQTVTGTLNDGQAQVTLTNQSRSSNQTWIFSPASVDLGTGTVLSVVACSSVAAQLP